MSERSYHGATSRSFVRFRKHINTGLAATGAPVMETGGEEVVMGEREMFYLTTHSTHFYLRLYGVGHMVKYHSDSERKPAAATWATLSD